MTRADSDQGQSIYRLRWVGYGLLLLALFDTIEVLTPPQFTNPAWEFQTIGALVERVPVPLLGLVLVFFWGIFQSQPIRRNFPENLVVVLSFARRFVSVAASLGYC